MLIILLILFYYLIPFFAIYDYSEYFQHLLLWDPFFLSVVAMIKDILKFFIFFAVFILSFTWAFMGFVNEHMDANFAETYPTGPVLLPLWATFGEFASSFNYLDNVEPVGLIFLAFYLFSADILLINLLIAMMNDSYSRIQNNADKEWKFARASLISEYESVSAIPPPFNLIQLLFEILWACVPKNKCFEDDNDEEDILEPNYLETANGQNINTHPAKSRKETPQEREQTILTQLNLKRNAFLEKRDEKKS